MKIFFGIYLTEEVEQASKPLITLNSRIKKMKKVEKKAL